MTVKGRRQEYVEATRAALLESATELFTEKGFAQTSLDEVAAAARLTKGALYHHFANKQALFEQVLQTVNDRIAETVIGAGAGEDGPWARLTRGLDAFLDACLDREYQRICLQQAPAVLGWERCRELEARMMGLLDAMLHELAESGQSRLQPSPLLTRVLFRMLSEAAMVIGEATDPAAARAEVGALVGELLHSVHGGSPSAATSR
ncbi:TetR/AcrR family transcriptional regulator [Streptomyces montanus]|uniref:TetR/AcrR family transcriptional regulator n=1 Tax=Streptomyces montanus TaxID=2580423 RepID=A0A5R9FJ14_9ACTN|nr:TetR/AcrR family transcriptional regulator [Streptomyces montanus]TLS41558.1 TetR/AcrR family transcriptional regulator [Streptomyces montanus]